MLVNAVISTFTADRTDEAARIFVELAGASKREPGCVRLDVNRSNDDPRVFNESRLAHKCTPLNA